MLEWIISSSVLIAVIIAVRFILKGKISLHLQYALWALVLVRLLLPVSLGNSSMSIMNQVENSQVYRDVMESEPNTPEVNTPETVVPNQPVGENTVPSAPDNVTPPVIIPNNGASVGDTGQSEQTGQNTPDLPETPSVSDTPQPQADGSIDWQTALRFVWFAGSVLLGAWFVVTNLLFAARVRKNRIVLETAHKLPLYVCGTVDTPCLFGFFRPAIYLTEDVAADERIMRHAVEHELTHFRHRDHIWALLRCVCLAIHWYNPLVWWAAILSRNDAELACDESTIRRLGESERAEYGRTLLRLTCEKRTALLTTATTMTGSGKSIKERIALIVHKPKMAVYTLLAVIIIAAVAVGCTFTGAKDRPHSFTEWTESLTVADIQLAEVSREYGSEQVAYTLPEGEYEELCALLTAITDENCSLTKPESDNGDGYRLILYRADKLWLFKCLSDGTVGLMFNDEETGAYFGCEGSLLIIECPELWDYIVSMADEKGVGKSDDTSEDEDSTGEQEQLTDEQIRGNAVIKTLASLTAEDINYVPGFIGTDYSDVAVLLNDLEKHKTEEFEYSAAHWSLTVFLSGSPEESDHQNDEWLMIYACDKENLVHILYHSKFRTYTQMYFDYPALYQYVRSFYHTDSVIDADALDLYKDILSARAEHIIEVRNSNSEEAKFLGYEIAAFHQIGSFERDGAAYKVYEWDVAFLTDDTDYPWTMNRIWVDAELRVRSYDSYPYFAVRSDGENEQYAFCPWDIPLHGTDHSRETGYDEIVAYFASENGIRGSVNSANSLTSVSYDKIENGFLYQLGNNSVVAISGGTPDAIPMTGAQTTVVRNGREISVEYSWARYGNALAASSHSGSYSVVPLTGSGRYLELIFDMGYTYLIDTTTGEVRDPLAVLDTAITERLGIVNFSADGQYAVVSYNSGTACILLNCSTGEITQLPYASDIYSVSGYLLDQTRIMLISGFEVGAPHEVEYSRSIYDITTGELTELPGLYTAKDSSAPNFLCGLGDGKLAYTFDENRYLVIVDQTTGERTVTQFKDTDVDWVFYCPDALAGVLCNGVIYIVDYDGTAHAVCKAEE